MEIEIITTSNNDLKETGFGTLKACTSVLNVIAREGHIVRVAVCETKDDLDNVVQREPDLVILAVKYISFKSEEDIWLTDYFSENNINYMGSLRETLKFDSNKLLAKAYLRSKGIKTANYFIATPGEYKCEADLPVKFPLFLKPMDAANGNGVDDLSFVDNFSSFESKVLSLYELFDLPVLVEEYLDGREFTVAILNTLHEGLIVSPIEIVPPESTGGLRILGQKVKTEDSEELKEIMDIVLKKRISRLAVDAFINLGGRDFGRVDIKSRKNGDCYFLEANLVPGMTEGSSYFPKACEIDGGYTYDKVVSLLLEKGLSRVSSRVAVPDDVIEGASASIMI